MAGRKPKPTAVKKLQTVGNKISSVGQKLLPVTGVVTGLGTAAVKTAADFDSAMSRVAAVSGAVNNCKDAAKNMADTMPDGMKRVIMIVALLAAALSATMMANPIAIVIAAIAALVAALKDVLGDQKGQQGDLVIPVYLGNQLLDEVIVTGYKAKLKKDTSYKGLWTVSFTLKEM